MKIERLRHHYFADLIQRPGYAVLADHVSAEDLAVFIDRGLAFAGFVDGEVVGAGGIYRMQGKVGQAWALFAPEALAHPIALTRAVASGLLWVTAELGVSRVQATVVDGHVAGHRFAKFLGFEVEGFMKKYGLNEEDHWMYARVT